VSERASEGDEDGGMEEEGQGGDQWEERDGEGFRFRFEVVNMKNRLNSNLQMKSG